MTDARTQKILGFIGQLITKGQRLENTSRVIEKGTMRLRGNVDMRRFGEWFTQVEYLAEMLGDSGGPLQRTLEKNRSASYEHYSRVLGSLQGLRPLVKDGLLFKIEDLVTADAFGSLLEQAEYLLQAGYPLAAGVCGRAVLEEHLRKLCVRNSCLPSGRRPTIEALKQSLQKAGHLDRIASSKVDTMAAVGNHCAHNMAPPRDTAEVRKFLGDVRDFLAKYTA